MDKYILQKYDVVRIYKKAWNLYHVCPKVKLDDWLKQGWSVVED